MINRIDCHEAKRMIEQDNAQFVDVRTPEEFSEGALPGAVNIPLQDVAAVAETQIDAGRPLVLYCRSGNRSQMAIQMLVSMGYDVNDMADLGPFTAWFACE